MVDMSEFDMAADAAEQELHMMLEKDPELRKAVAVLAKWWKRHFMKAGHKRLGRIINKFA